MKRNIIHIKVDQSLNPSYADMKALLTMFSDAQVEDLNRTIVTLSGIDCRLEVTDVQEGNDLSLVTVAMYDAEEEAAPNDVVEIWRVGKIEGNRVFDADDEANYCDMDADAIANTPLNNGHTYFARYGDGTTGFLVKARS